MVKVPRRAVALAFRISSPRYATVTWSTVKIFVSSAFVTAQTGSVIAIILISAKRIYGVILRSIARRMRGYIELHRSLQ